MNHITRPCSSVRPWAWFCLVFWLAAIAWMVSGCSKTSAELTTDSGLPGSVVAVPNNAYVVVYDMKLSDGTRCAVYSMGGISCDWSRE